MNKPKTESQLLSSFKTYLKTAVLLTEDKLKQVRVADKIFIETYGFSWIQKFEKALKKIHGKDLVLVNSGAEVAERHQTGEKTSRGLNKGFAPFGYLNKGDLAKLINERYECPTSMTEAILDKFEHLIKQKTYDNEVEIAGCAKIVKVPCFNLVCFVTVLFHVTNSAVQKTTKKKTPSCMCYFPELDMKFKFNLERFRSIRSNLKSA